MTRNQTLFVVVADLLALVVLAADFFWGTGGLAGAVVLFSVAGICLLLMLSWKRSRAKRPRQNAVRSRS